MRPQIIGISGSPVKNSNTDRLIKAVLESSELASEFIKLSEIDIRPCRACLGCRTDNICVVPDDFRDLADKVRHAGAVVIGGYSPYGTIDGFTKAFLERLFSLRHRRGLNRGKLAVVVCTGNGRGVRGVEEASEQIAYALEHEGMTVLGCLKATGNPKCLTCGYGETCPLSALPRVFGKDTCVTPDKFRQVEDQVEVWMQAGNLGRQIKDRLNH